MPKEVNHLGVPPMDLTFSDAGNGKLRVELNVPRSSGSKDNIPFLEVTRNEQQVLLNGAKQDMLAKLSQSGFTIGEIKVESSADYKAHGGGSAAGKVPGVGKVSFEISADPSVHSGMTGSIKNNPDVAGAIREAESKFDTRRQDIYEQRAREWHRDGGATLTSDGQTYHVGKEAAKEYINERYPHKVWKHVSADDGSVQVASASPTLDIGNSPLSKNLAQAVNSAPDKDTGALAFETIKNANGYKPTDDIRVLQGNNGTTLVAQRENDPSGIVLQVPQGKPGDFERVSTQDAKEQAAQQSVTQLTNTQQPQQNQSPLEQEPRKGPSIA
jgi:hypothetical protein